MSKEVRNTNGGERDISRLTIGNGQRKSYEGFEGMNYEQFRQPYNPEHGGTNNRDERKDSKRPDEA